MTRPDDDSAEDVPNSPSGLRDATASEQVEQLAPAAQSETGTAQSAPANEPAGDPATFPRRLWLSAGVAVVVALVAVTWWLLSKGTRGAEIATVLALAVAVLVAMRPADGQTSWGASSPWTGTRPTESSPVRSRQRAFAWGGITVVVVAAVIVAAVIVFDGRKPGSDADVLFRDNFEDPDRGWDVGQTQNGIEEYISDQYRISANPGGVAVWSAAPAVRPAAAVKIIATARIANGQGGWGVWCRGTDTGERYEFSVTHAGVAYIKPPGEEKGTGPVSIPDFDAYQDTHVVAECRDAPNGAGVALTLAVNGKRIGPYLHQGPLLGPGKVGVHAFSFGDVHGDPADVRFSYLEVDRLR